jgi:hypothetical protein
MNFTLWKVIIFSQTLSTLGSGKNIGISYMQFGVSYGLFTLSAAFFQLTISKYLRKANQGNMLAYSSFGTALIF